MSLFFVSALILASEPTGSLANNISGALTQVELVESFRSQAVAQGLSESYLQVACRDLDEDLVLCLRNEDSDSRWWLSVGEMTDMGLSFDSAAGSIAARAQEVLLNKRVVHEGTGEFWIASQGGVGAEALLFSPHLLSVVGDRPAIAVPERGVVIAWNRGDSDLDRIMAVGVRRMFEASANPVTSKILALVDSEWRVWLQAVENSE